MYLRLTFVEKNSENKIPDLFISYLYNRFEYISIVFVWFFGVAQ